MPIMSGISKGDEIGKFVCTQVKVDPPSETDPLDYIIFKRPEGVGIEFCTGSNRVTLVTIWDGNTGTTLAQVSGKFDDISPSDILLKSDSVLDDFFRKISDFLKDSRMGLSEFLDSEISDRFFDDVEKRLIKIVKEQR